MTEPLVAAGWREWIALPELGIRRLRAKLDTGAKSSALHVEWMELIEADGARRVRFETEFGSRKKPRRIVVESDVIDDRIVRASSGHEEERTTIRTTLEIGGAQWPISITLTSRSSMRFPMLIGRRAMEGRIIVDPAQSFVLGPPQTPTVTS